MITGAGIFPCPRCGEMIYSDAKQCRFCSAPVDINAAARGALLQKQVNDACNHAKMMRHGAVTMWVFAIGSFFLGQAFWGYLGLMFLIPVWVIYWQVNYAKLETGDPDFKVARRDRLMALLMWLPSPLLLLVIGDR